MPAASDPHAPDDRPDVPLADRAGPGAPAWGALLAVRYGLDRRGFLLGLAAAVAAPRAIAGPRGRGPGSLELGPLDFEPLAGSGADAVRVPPGFRADVVVGFGDALGALVDDLDTARIPDGVLLEPGAGARTARRFGFNNDFLAWIDLPGHAREPRRRGLLWVNHEFADAQNLFPGWPRGDGAAEGAFLRAHPEALAVLQAAHGGSLVEIARGRDGRWRPRRGSLHNRRITAGTPIELTGPAAGHPLLRTAADPSGRRVLGTLNNCAGGTTPWGTVLTCEENVDKYFQGLEALRERAAAARDPELAGAVAAHARLAPARRHSEFCWGAAAVRFDVSRTPHEPFRFGWVVEVDPLRPEVPPKKRTALGRFKHESATCTLCADGRVAVYSGDDAQFEYLYKFVTADRFDPARPERNADLLDRGTLHVARLEADGSGRWIPLVAGRGPLTAKRGFRGQGDVVVRAREAADLVGATPLDRPEDVEVSPVDGRVYVALTNNGKRRPADADEERVPTYGRDLDRRADAAGPRGPNRHGHVLEIVETGADAAALELAWGIFLLCGDPLGAGRLVTRAEDLVPGLGVHDTWYAGRSEARALAALGSPDNLAFDRAGNLWIATDGNARTTGCNDGVFAVPVAGPERGRVRQFLSGPRECEICGPLWAPDGETFLCAVQHPGYGGSVEAPTSAWPDGDGRPPRPAVVAVTRG